MRDGYDIVIVGAGAAGCVLTRRLAERGDADVLLLEAGPDLRDDPPAGFRDGWHLPTVPDWGFAAEPRADGSAPTLRRGRLVGGTAWLTRFAVRGARADFDAWAAAGNPGWSYADVLPAFRRLETDLEFGGETWHGDDGPIPITRYPGATPSEIHAAAVAGLRAIGFPMVEDHNGPTAVGVGRMPMSSRDGRRITAADAYLPAADAAPYAGSATLPGSGPAGDRLPTLTIRAGSPVARVRLAGRRAVGVELVDGARIRASTVILSAGTYGSPPILLRSGIGPAADLARLGIACVANLPGVGANLADHPGVDVPSGWRGVGRDHPILHSMATWRSSLADIVPAVPSSSPDLMIWLTDPDTADPGFYLDPILLSPVARGSVGLRSADPSDPPRIALPQPSDSMDIDRLVEGLRMSVELAHRPELRAVCPDDPPMDPGSAAGRRRYVLENGYSLPHVVGTCAMGPSPDDGAVVDARCRVHGLEGLFVADASVIPMPSSGYPHVITLMLAERLVELLREATWSS